MCRKSKGLIKRTEWVTDFFSRKERGQRANNKILIKQRKLAFSICLEYSRELLIGSLHRNCEVVLLFTFEKEGGAQRIKLLQLPCPEGVGGRGGSPKAVSHRFLFWQQFQSQALSTYCMSDILLEREIQREKEWGTCYRVFHKAFIEHTLLVRCSHEGNYHTWVSELIIGQRGHAPQLIFQIVKSTCSDFLPHSYEHTVGEC